MGDIGKGARASSVCPLKVGSLGFSVYDGDCSGRISLSEMATGVFGVESDSCSQLGILEGYYSCW